MRCLTCGITCGTDVGQDPNFHRVNDYDRPGVWTCERHAPQSLHTFAAAKGVDAVRPDLREAAQRSLKVMQAT